MSTPIVVLVYILAFFAIVLISFMMIKGTGQKKHGSNANLNQGKKQQKKKKRK